METIDTMQYGVEYPDGTLDWTAADAWGALWDPLVQQDFQRNYEARLLGLGVKAGQVSFVQRTVHIQYGDPEAAVPPSSAEPIEEDTTDDGSDPDA